MDLKIDFVRDYTEVLRQRLLAAGYQPVAGEIDEDTIIRYLNVLRTSRQFLDPKRTTQAQNPKVIGSNLLLADIISFSKCVLFPLWPSKQRMPHLNVVA
jgi:hypothetical protein